MQTQVTQLEKTSFLSLVKTYIQLTKPGIIMGNSMTAFAGFVLATRGAFPIFLFLKMIFGLGLIIASGCVYNNYIDKESDKKMQRTQNRPFPKERISPKKALVFALVLVFLGTFVLSFFVNILTAAFALMGFAVYVFAYSLLKYKTSYATLIGSIAGAIPPVVGYTSVTSTLSLASLCLFGIVAIWQMPHFYAIALYRLEEYKAAGIPVLPVVKGILATKKQMVFYTICFILVSSSLSFLGYVDYSFLFLFTLVGFFWLIFSLKGFKEPNEKIWGRHMFIFSLVVMNCFCVMVPITVL